VRCSTPETSSLRKFTSVTILSARLINGLWAFGATNGSYRSPCNQITPPFSAVKRDRRANVQSVPPNRHEFLCTRRRSVSALRVTAANDYGARCLIKVHRQGTSTLIQRGLHANHTDRPIVRSIISSLRTHRVFLARISDTWSLIFLASPAWEREKVPHIREISGTLESTCRLLLIPNVWLPCKYAFFQAERALLARHLQTDADSRRQDLSVNCSETGDLWASGPILSSLYVFAIQSSAAERLDLLSYKSPVPRHVQHLSMPPDSDSVIISQYIDEELIPPASREQTNYFDFPLVPPVFFLSSSIFLVLPFLHFQRFLNRAPARDILFLRRYSPVRIPLLTLPFSLTLFSLLLSLSLSSFLPQSANSRSRKSPAKLNERT